MRGTPELRGVFHAALSGKRRVVIFTANREYQGAVVSVGLEEVILVSPVVSTDEDTYTLALEADRLVIQMAHIEGAAIIRASEK